MKAFIADIIPKIQRFSKKIDDLVILTNHHWVSLNDLHNSKVVFIFRSNKEMLISNNGNVSKGAWEYLGNESVLVEINGLSTLYKHAFIDDHVLALKIDGNEGYYLFVNEGKCGQEINSIEDVSAFLEKKYFVKDVPKTYSVDERGVPEYTESLPETNFDIAFGWFDRIELTFGDDLRGEIYLGHKSRKYFFVHLIAGKIYFEDKVECIKRFYRHRKFNE